MTPAPARLSHNPTVETAEVSGDAGAVRGVLGRAERRPPWSDAARGVLAGALALLVHATLFVATRGLPCGFSHAPRLRSELDHAHELVPLEAFEEDVSLPPAPAPAPSAPVTHASARAAAAPARPSAPAPAAPSAAEPVADFTNVAGAFPSATTFAVAPSRAVVGPASSGGAGSAGTGTGSEAGGTGAGSGTGAGTGTGTSSSAAPTQAARPVSSQWRCPWPSAAVAADLYQQSVTVRVVVGVDGTVERASAVRDPGHGFGAAAEACARRERFTPARDASGQAVRATAPPIRVRFER